MRGFCLAARLSTRLDGSCSLYELGSAIAALGDALHVKRLDVPSWAQFLQILEDTGPAWMVDVLCRPAAQSITAREALKNLLTATDPGGAVSCQWGARHRSRGRCIRQWGARRWHVRKPSVGSMVCLEGYVYVGTNQGLAIWGRADIVQASLTDPDRHPRAGCGDAL